jgi:hypothetical protein
VPHFQGIHELSLCCDSDLHSGDETSTHTSLSIGLFRICGPENAKIFNYNLIFIDSNKSDVDGFFDISNTQSSDLFMNYLIENKAIILFFY